MSSVADSLKSQLAPEQLQDLEALVKHREWINLLLLFRLLEQVVEREFREFKTAEEAFERRGKLIGITLALEVITNLTSGGQRGITSETGIGTSRTVWNPNPDGSGVGIAAPENPADTEPRSPSY